MVAVTVVRLVPLGRVVRLAEWVWVVVVVASHASLRARMILGAMAAEAPVGGRPSVESESAGSCGGYTHVITYTQHLSTVY
jgi:hypothetical protein